MAPATSSRMEEVPQVPPLTVDREEHLVKVPRVARAGSSAA
jgi:hypothetical protein